MAQNYQNATNAIANDPNLTDAQKQDRQNALDTAHATAESAMNAAQTPAAANSVVASGSDFDKATQTAKDDSNVTPLASQKTNATGTVNGGSSNAQNAIDQQATAAENAIDLNGNLTPEQKAVQKAVIQKAAEQANADINNASNAQQIVDAQNKANDIFNNLSNDKTEARKSLAQQAQNAIDGLEANKDLTDADRQAREQAIKSAYNTAAGQVDSAPDAASVTAAENSSDFANALKTNTDVSGVKSLADQKTAAVQKLQEALLADQATIDQDPSLSQSDKDAQKQTLAQVEQAAEGNITGATDAQAASDAEAAAEGALTTLDNAKTAANKTLAQNYQDASNAIKNDVNLTDAQKQDRQNALNAAHATAESAMNAAQTPAAADSVVTSGSDFDKATQTAQDDSNVTPLASQKTNATGTVNGGSSNAQNAIDQQATAAENAIDLNGNLTPEQKAVQKQVIQNAAKQANTDINNASNAQQIADAQNKANDIFNNLSNDKTAARKSLAQQAQNAIDGLEANKDLTDADRQAREQAIKSAYNTAAGNVDSAPDAASVTAAENSTDFANALKTNTDVSGVTPLATQKTDAVTKLQNALKADQAIIDQDPSLSQADKDAQKQTLAKVEQAAEGNITGANDAQAASDAEAAGEGTLTTLDNAKTTANAALLNDYNNAKQAIENNANLTPSQKQDRENALDAAHATAQSALNNAQNPTDTNAVVAPGSTFENAADTAKSNDGVLPIADQQAAAVSQVETALTNAKNAVDQDPNLSDADKAAQKATLAAQAATYEKAIKAASDATTIANDQTAGSQALQDLQASYAKNDAALAKAVSQTQNAINTDPNLSGSDKQSRLTALKTAQENAQNAINTATSPAQADSTLATGSDFNKATQAATDDSSVTPLATQKSNAANQLDNDKAGVDAPINNDSTLSPAEQAAEVQAANNILDQAKTTAANAADADSVANAVASAVQAANALHDTKTGLLNQLDQEATNTISNLQKNKALTAAQEGQLEQNVKDALAKARTAVAAAPDAASAQNAAQSSDFANALQAAQQASDDTPTLSAQAGTDGATLANLVQQAKNALTGSNASAQGAALDQLLGQMKDDLAKQTDADAMAKELAADTAAINGMNAAKAAAISTLADKAQAADKALDANVNLTDDERQDRKNAVAAALATATDAVNQATSADTATAESNSSDYADDLANATSGQGVKSLADRQADATRALQVEETVLANKIDNDPTLTAAERQAQKDALAQATAQAGQAITNAGNATAVENSLNLATQTLDTLQATKQADRASLAADYQSATAAIKQNDTLTDAQKADRQAALDKAYQAAKDGLNADQSTTGVQADPNYTGFATAKNTATDFSAVPSLADQKVAAKKTLAQAEVDAEAEVQKDPSLDAAAKTRQIQALEAALTTAESNLDQQANAQDITDYTPAASKDFADMNQTKAQGRQTLNTDAANQIAAINNDSTLSADQKQAEIQSVQAALAKALAKIDDGQDVPAIKAVLESADVQANVVTGHHPAPANQAAVSELARTSLEPAVTPKLGAQPAAVKAQTPATKAAQPATRVEKHGDKDHAKKAPVAQKATGISQKKLIDAGFLTSAIGTMAWGFAKRYKKN